VIILAATPIGNLGDASARLVEALSTATVIAAEDTRVTLHLMRALGIENRPRLIPLHEHNEVEKAAELIELARETDVLVLSDAGMPAISDPGFTLVSAAAAAGVTVTAIPGPSAVLTALALSGLPTDRFCFEGFLPRKASDRRRALTALAREPRTMVFFESPNRLAESLADIAEVLGAERRVAVVRELTKKFEEVRRGGARELSEWASTGVKGEIVIVVDGGAPQAVDLEAGVAQVKVLVASGIRLKDAAAEVAEATGLSKRELYQAALASRAE
jgi:16S rRNA (cytidine1402-2'-O)-methyltransferase